MSSSQAGQASSSRNVHPLAASFEQVRDKEDGGLRARGDGGDMEDSDDEDEDDEYDLEMVQDADEAPNDRTSSKWALGYYMEETKIELERLYTEWTTAENKACAEKAYPWVVARFEAAPDYKRYFETVVEDAPGKRRFVRAANTHSSRSFHGACNELYPTPLPGGNSDEHVTKSGVEYLTAIAFRINGKVQDRVMLHIEKTPHLPLPMDLWRAISLGDARLSKKCGVYALRHKNGAGIIGYCVGTGYAFRLGAARYSKSKRVRKRFHKGDHRIDREDFILFDLSTLPAFMLGKKAWLGQALECWSIVCFSSTTLPDGLNSRSLDNFMRNRSLTAEEGYELFEAIRSAAALERIPALASPDFAYWVKRRLPDAITEFMTARAIYGKIRWIQGEAYENDYVHFPPLDAALFANKAPLRQPAEDTRFLVTQVLTSHSTSPGPHLKWSPQLNLDTLGQYKFNDIMSSLFPSDDREKDVQLLPDAEYKVKSKHMAKMNQRHRLLLGAWNFTLGGADS